MTKKARKKSKIKSCVIIDHPTTPQDQETFDRKVAKELAQVIYRSFSDKEYGHLIKSLKAQVSSEKTIQFARNPSSTESNYTRTI